MTEVELEESLGDVPEAAGGSVASKAGCLGTEAAVLDDPMGT